MVPALHEVGIMAACNHREASAGVFVYRLQFCSDLKLLDTENRKSKTREGKKEK